MKKIVIGAFVALGLFVVFGLPNVQAQEISSSQDLLTPGQARELSRGLDSLEGTLLGLKARMDFLKTSGNLEEMDQSLDSIKITLSSINASLIAYGGSSSLSQNQTAPENYPVESENNLAVGDLSKEATAVSAISSRNISIPLAISVGILAIATLFLIFGGKKSKKSESQVPAVKEQVAPIQTKTEIPPQTNQNQ